MRWKYSGLVSYLDAAAARLGLSQVSADRARSNPEIRRAAVLCTQMHERYVRSKRGPGGTAELDPRERSCVAGTLGEAAKEAAKLHALAAAAEAMIDEAWRAFGLAPPERPYRVVAGSDDPPPLTPINLKGHCLGYAHPEQRHAGEPGE